MERYGSRLSRISLCVLARDEDEHLAGLLETTRPYVDEIVVWIDDRTTDRSEKIARGLAEVVQVGRLGMDFAGARNACQALATGEWVLSLDPDERPLPGLLEWFREARDVADACLSVHENRIDGRPVPGHYLEWKCRFFRRKYRWVGRIHERLLLGEARVLVAPEHLRILHYKSQARQEMQNARYAAWDVCEKT
jgi:glycosyltransferase involved in cell wall biosynthesis